MTTTLQPAQARASQPTLPDLRPLPNGASAVLDGDVIVEGVLGRLIGHVSYIDMIFFQTQSRYPTVAEASLMEAYLVSLCEHGVTTSPSTRRTRSPRASGRPSAPARSTS